MLQLFSNQFFIAPLLVDVETTCFMNPHERPKNLSNFHKTTSQAKDIIQLNKGDKFIICLAETQVLISLPKKRIFTIKFSATQKRDKFMNKLAQRKTGDRYKVEI